MHAYHDPLAISIYAMRSSWTCTKSIPNWSRLFFCALSLLLCLSLAPPFIMIYDKQSQKRHRFFFLFDVASFLHAVIISDVPLRSKHYYYIFFQFIIALDAEWYFLFSSFSAAHDIAFIYLYGSLISFFFIKFGISRELFFISLEWSKWTQFDAYHLAEICSWVIESNTLIIFQNRIRSSAWFQTKSNFKRFKRIIAKWKQIWIKNHMWCKVRHMFTKFIWFV